MDPAHGSTPSRRRHAPPNHAPPPRTRARSRPVGSSQKLNAPRYQLPPNWINNGRQSARLPQNGPHSPRRLARTAGRSHAGQNGQPGAGRGRGGRGVSTGTGGCSGDDCAVQVLEPLTGAGDIPAQVLQLVAREPLVLDVVIRTQPRELDQFRDLGIRCRRIEMRLERAKSVFANARIDRRSNSLARSRQATKARDGTAEDPPWSG